MNKIMVCNLNKYDETYSLIYNVFNKKYNGRMNMLKKIGRLLDTSNINNMNIFLIENEVASHIAFYPTKICINNSQISIAQIGGVATKDRYRNMGCASKLLRVIDNKLKNNNISLALISGRYNIYINQNYLITGKGYEFFLYKKNVDFKDIQYNFDFRLVALSNYSDNYIKIMHDIYNKNNVKFKRTLEEFKIMLENSTSDFKEDIKHKVIFIRENNFFTSYVVLRIYEEEKRTADIIECCGNYVSIYNSMYTMLNLYDIYSIRYRNTANDELVNILLDNNVKYNKIYFPGAIKILSFVKLEFGK